MTLRSVALALTTLAAGSVAPAPALARQEGTPPNPRAVFSQLDADGDGTVVRDEVPPAGRDAFNRMLKAADGNGDGKIDTEEFRRAGEALRGLAAQAPAARFRQADRDGDGRITKAEFPGAPERFARLDRNGDGAIDREEMTAAFRAAAPRRDEPADRERDPAPPREGPRDGDRPRPEGDRGDQPRPEGDRGDRPRPEGDRGDRPRPGPGETGRRGMGPSPFGMPPLLLMDTDRDGKVSREEFRKGHDAIFDRLDRNGDGALDASERPQPGGFGGPAGRGPGGPPPGPDGPPPGPGGPGGFRPGAPGLPMFGQRLARMDANGDGRITEEEFDGPEAMFERLDRNGDDVIDRAELPALGRRPEGDRPRPEARPEGRPRDGEARPGRGPRDGEARPGRGPRDGEARPEGRPRDGGPRERGGDADRPADDGRKPEAAKDKP
jgi:Ca2+-binding EF-hand superfamily protein